MFQNVWHKLEIMVLPIFREYFFVIYNERIMTNRSFVYVLKRLKSVYKTGKGGKILLDKI